MNIHKYSWKWIQKTLISNPLFCYYKYLTILSWSELRWNPLIQDIEPSYLWYLAARGSLELWAIHWRPLRMHLCAPGSISYKIVFSSHYLEWRTRLLNDYQCFRQLPDLQMLRNNDFEILWRVLTSLNEIKM